MSEAGVLDLGEYGATDAALRRKQQRMARFFMRNPKLMPSAAALTFSRGRFSRNHPLVQVNEMLPNRQQTTYTSKLIAKQTGVSPGVRDTKGPAAIRTAYTPQAYAARRGWWPGTAVAAETKPPWSRGRRVAMGVRARIRGPGIAR